MAAVALEGFDPNVPDLTVTLVGALGADEYFWPLCQLPPVSK